MTNEKLVQGQQLKAQIQEVEQKLTVLDALSKSADERYANSIVITITPGSPNSCTINDRVLLADVGATLHAAYLQMYQALNQQFQDL